MLTKVRVLRIVVLASALAACTAPAGDEFTTSGDIVMSSRSSKSAADPLDERMSAMGRRAQRVASHLARSASTGDEDEGEGDGPILGHDCHADPDCDENGPNGGGQAETSIAVDRSGVHVVIGANDTRGFASNPISVSGFAYSEDGGKTFIDGGQLPSPGNQTIGASKLPQVFGDPELEYVGDCTFLYTSIMLRLFTATTTVQTLSVHRSLDCGKTWQGPFEITAASNPSGSLNANGGPTDAADKEFTSVDPETGRVIVTWSNFTPNAPGGVEISSSYSDDILAETPTWSPRAIIANGPQDGQASIPVFAAHSDKVYVAWRKSGTTLNHSQTGFARSLDNGQTWEAPIDVATPEFFTNDQVIGNDRINTSPSLSVFDGEGEGEGDDDHHHDGDHHHGDDRRAAKRGVFLAYGSNDRRDGADIVFQRSDDDGQTFSAPVAINSRPGADRSQWFPWITVDQDRGRLYAFYYDQGIDTSGDLTETSFQLSDDGGRSWSQPRPLSARPFHAAHGNDTGQPNLGDYNQAVAQHGELFAVFATTRQPGYQDGQPTSTSFTVPEATVRRLGVFDQLPSVGVALGDLTAVDASGSSNLDPGDRVAVTAPLRNVVTNALNARAIRNAIVIARTSTPGVRVRRAVSVYGSLAPGETKTATPFDLELASSFVPGTPIELAFTAFGSTGVPTQLSATVLTGTPARSMLLSEGFDSVAPGALPAGWSTVHAGGANVVPWRTATGFCGASNGAFHDNADDGPTLGAGTRFERLFSPTFAVPADAEYVELDMDVCFDTEDQPDFNVLAFDGFLVRITDLTPGHLVRSVLVDAFAQQFTTGASKGYPKHLPRSNNPNYFADMSVWSGDSHGIQHVHARLPGMAGVTAQLRVEFTQDGTSTCADVRPGHSCGVFVDNIAINSVRSQAALVIP